MNETIQGRIIASSGGLYTVVSGNDEINCRARGVFRHKNEKPLVGDIVTLLSENGGYVISDIIRRKNELIRPPMANLDIMFVTVASESPEPDTGTVDKLTAIALHNDIKPVVVITKCDLNSYSAERLHTIYRKVGFDVIKVSTVTGDGCDELKAYIERELEGKVGAFAGVSGVGKSSIMKTLFPDKDFAVNTVSEKTLRGRHTTRSVTLYPIGGGHIADTPGFSMIDFENFDFFSKDDLPYAFPEVTDRIGECKYTKCTHTKEDGCAVIAAVESGEIPESRHESYVELFDILKNKHEWDKKQ